MALNVTTVSEIRQAAKLVDDNTASADIHLLLVTPVGQQDEHISVADFVTMIGGGGGGGTLDPADQAKLDHLTVTGPVDLDAQTAALAQAISDIDAVESDVAAAELQLDANTARLVSDHVNAETDLGLTPNNPSSRDTILADPGPAVRGANKTAFDAFLAASAATPNTQREVFFPSGSFAIDGPLDTATHAAAFKNITLRGVRPEYHSQAVESGAGGREWATRLDIYNAGDDDYFIDLPGSANKSIRPASLHISNMFVFLGSQKDMEEGNTFVAASNYVSAAAKFQSSKGGFLRVGDRALTGNDATNDWSDLARGVRVSGMGFSDWMLAPNNPLYGAFHDQGAAGVTFHFPQRAMMEFNRCYEILLECNAFRGGVGYQLMLHNCDRPYVRGSRHLLGNASILNGVAHGDPTDPGYDRDFLVDDGVAGVFDAIYVENPSLYGIFTAGGMWDNVRAEVGYPSLYPAYGGPGRYSMPAGVTWTLPWRNLAAPVDGELEEQYVEFAGLDTLGNITPYYGATPRPAKLSDYVYPGMTLTLNDTFPSLTGLPQISPNNPQMPTVHLIVTAVDDVNSRAIVWGAYRSATGSIIGPNFFGRNLAGDHTQITRIVGVPFTIATGRGGLGMHSITQNEPNLGGGVPRYVASYDRTIVPVGPYVGGHGSFASAAMTDTYRPIVSAYSRGQVDVQGCGVVHYGPIPPRSWARIAGWGTDLGDTPVPYKDYRLPRPESFDFYTSPVTGYQQTDWQRPIHDIWDDAVGDVVPCMGMDAAAAYLAFEDLPPATYDFTMRIWSPITLRSNNTCTSVTEQTTGPHTGKAKITFSADHWHHVGQLISIGGTGNPQYDVALNVYTEILEVPDSTSIVVDIDHTVDHVGSFETYPNLDERILLNFRDAAAPDGPGTNWYFNPGGPEFVLGIDQGWNTITGQTAADTVHIYSYTAGLKLWKFAWMGLKTV